MCYSSSNSPQSRLHRLCSFIARSWYGSSSSSERRSIGCSYVVGWTVGGGSKATLSLFIRMTRSGITWKCFARFSCETRSKVNRTVKNWIPSGATWCWCASCWRTASVDMKSLSGRCVFCSTGIVSVPTVTSENSFRQTGHLVPRFSAVFKMHVLQNSWPHDRLALTTLSVQMQHVFSGVDIGGFGLVSLTFMSAIANFFSFCSRTSRCISTRTATVESWNNRTTTSWLVVTKVRMASRSPSLALSYVVRGMDKLRRWRLLGPPPPSGSSWFRMCFPKRRKDAMVPRRGVVSLMRFSSRCLFSGLNGLMIPNDVWFVSFVLV